MFVIGQRWISETENNLGLGVITSLDARTVTIHFPAADEVRIYASNNAPLTRVSFQAGDEIPHQEGWKAKVLEAMERNGLFFYRVMRHDFMQDMVMLEQEIAPHIAFSKPQDRLFNAQIDRMDHFVLRYRSWQHQQTQYKSECRGLRGIRAGLIPHQLHIAQEVGQRMAPRVLLADEVGLGKTIEAGMILQQQLFAEKVQRVLILVPESLQHQWLVEMLRRFNLPFSLFDEERAADFDDSARNPFHSESLILCALDWFVSYPKRAQQALEAEFDLLIVDEAHHLTWSEVQCSLEYQIVAQLAEKIPALLLLTATPEQLGQESHFARLRLLDPHRFYDYHAFLREQEHYRPLAEIINALLQEETLSLSQQQTLQSLLDEESAVLITQVSVSVQARQQLIAQLIDRHGTGRVLFRNTRQAVQGFPKRMYAPVKLPFPTQYQNALSILQRLGEIGTVEALYPERIFQEMNALSGWWEFDPRVAWLFEFLKQRRDEKVLVICRHADTVTQLEQVLREKEGIRSAVFHEQMSIVERDRAAAYFADQEYGAQVLLTSHIGSEGRNFQFASHLVLFNVPETPDLLEQCIGRLDRIGQRGDVHIHVPYFDNSAQQVLVRWYHEGLNAFAETCPMGTLLFEKCGEKLRYFLQNPTALEEFHPFLQQTHEQYLVLKAELERGRDRLLELNSNGGEAAKQLAAQIAQQDGATDLISFSLNLFDLIGVEQEDVGEQTLVLKPGDNMLISDFPGLKEEGLIVTFDRARALAREEMDFLTWDHPLIRQGMELMTLGDIGKSAVSLLINKALPAGTLLLELIYIVEAQAPKGLHLTRFLPPTPVRLLLDAKGNNLANQVAFDSLQKQLKPMGRKMAMDVIKMLRKQIAALLPLAEQQIISPAQQIIADAKQAAQQRLQAELNRLLALQKVNKNVRQDEIELVQRQFEQSLAQLNLASWRLDSLRVIVSNKE